MKKIQASGPTVSMSPRSMLNNAVAVIPAYNEEKTIQNIIKKTAKNGLYPIVVDDGSNDRTYKLATDLAKKINLVVLRNDFNQGKGQAINKAVRFIKKDRKLRKTMAFCILDADLQYNPDKIIKKIPKSIFNGEADLGLGYRDFENDVPYFRHKIANKIWIFLFNRLTGYRDINGEPIKDISGFRIYSRKALMSIEDFGSGYVTEAAILMLAVKNNWRIVQFKVDVDYNRKSSMSRGIKMFLAISYKILTDSIRHRLNR